MTKKASARVQATKILLCAIALGLTLSSCADTQVSTNATTQEPVKPPKHGPDAGFRDMKWGDPPTADMVRSTVQFAGLQTYLRGRENLVIANRETGAIAYFFYRDGLCRVDTLWLEAPARRDLDEIGEALMHAWGSPDQLEKNGERGWESSDGQTIATLKHHGDGPNIVTMSIGEIACMRSAAKEGAGL